MAQHDYVIDNSTGANVRADINSALQAIASNNSGSSAPSTTFATQFFADTSAGIMKLRNTSNNGYVNLFTLAGGIDVDAASNFNADVTFTGATSGRNIVFDKSDDALEFADDVKAKFGTGADLTIHHNGNDSFITHHLAGSGNNLHIEAANSIQFGNVGTTEVLAQMVPNGAFTAYFDNVQTFQTITNGVKVKNILTLEEQSGSESYQFVVNSFGGLDINNDTTKIAEFTDSSALNLLDDVKLTCGTSSDVELFHDGSNSFLKHVGTGNLFLQASGDTIFIRPKDNEDGVKIIDNGAVEIYFDDSKKFETTSTGITISNMSTNGQIIVSTAANLVEPLQIDDSINNNFSTHRISFRTGGTEVGNISANRSATTFNTSSDYRLKENAVAISDGITRLKTLKPYRFNFISDKDKTVDGFFAHEVTAVPEAITGTKDQVATEDNQQRNIKKGDPIYQSIDQSKLVPLLVAAVQELVGKVEALEAA